MVEYYAREQGRGLVGDGKRWDSKSAPAPLGGEKTGKNPTDKGKRGAKINLLVDERGAPISVVLTGANRHDKVSAIDLIISVAIKRPAHKEQHLCADKAYDATDMREFAISEGYIPHIKINPRREGTDEASDESSSENGSSEIHPARRWVVERTISWLSKRRSIRTRWAKKAENWLALVQFACAHILLNSCSTWRFSDRVLESTSALRYNPCSKQADVAQQVEQLTRNEQVSGSSPLVGSPKNLLFPGKTCRSMP